MISDCRALTQPQNKDEQELPGFENELHWSPGAEMGLVFLASGAVVVKSTDHEWSS
jgi:hypothetical protein